MGGEIIRGYAKIFVPLFAKRILPFCLATYMVATGLEKGSSFIENTEFGRSLGRLEETITSSDAYKGFSGAGSAVGSMR